MSSYKHLSLKEREKLVVFKEAGLSLRDIAKRSNEYLIFRYVPCKAHFKDYRQDLKDLHQFGVGVLKYLESFS